MKLCTFEHYDFDELQEVVVDDNGDDNRSVGDGSGNGDACCYPEPYMNEIRLFRIDDVVVMQRWNGTQWVPVGAEWPL